MRRVFDKAEAHAEPGFSVTEIAYAETGGLSAIEDAIKRASKEVPASASIAELSLRAIGNINKAQSAADNGEANEEGSASAEDKAALAAARRRCEKEQERPYEGGHPGQCVNARPGESKESKAQQLRECAETKANAEHRGEVESPRIKFDCARIARE